MADEKASTLTQRKSTKASVPAAEGASAAAAAGHAVDPHSFDHAPPPAPLADWVSVGAWVKYLDEWDHELTAVHPHPYVELVYAKIPPQFQAQAKRVHVYLAIYTALSLLTVATLGLEFFSHFVAFAPVVMHTLQLIGKAQRQKHVTAHAAAHATLNTDEGAPAAAAAAGAPAAIDEAVPLDGFSRDKQEHVWILMYWVLYALLTVLEGFFLPHAHHHADADGDDHDHDDGMSTASFLFHVFHLVFLAWCHSPVTRGSLVVYRKVFVPLRGIIGSFLSGQTAAPAAAPAAAESKKDK